MVISVDNDFTPSLQSEIMESWKMEIIGVCVQNVFVAKENGDKSTVILM